MMNLPCQILKFNSDHLLGTEIEKKLLHPHISKPKAIILSPLTPLPPSRTTQAPRTITSSSRVRDNLIMEDYLSVHRAK